jgi:hypothetical protein
MMTSPTFMDWVRWALERTPPRPRTKGDIMREAARRARMPIITVRVKKCPVEDIRGLPFKK